MDGRPLYEYVGRRVRKAREERGLTQEALASLISLSRTSVTNIEKGRQTIALHKFVEIADALRVDPSSLLPQRAGSRYVDLEPELPHSLSSEERSWIKTVVTSAQAIE
jgi:transcriptional regulator with XRE-family HTH domain